MYEVIVERNHINQKKSYFSPPIMGYFCWILWIIGMDVITQMDIAITNGCGQTQFSFIIPSLNEKIDFCNPNQIMNQ